MTRVDLLQALKKFTEEATANLILPTRIQNKGEEQGYRAPEVFLMRLPDSNSATKKAPYILHQLVTGKDIQAEKQQMENSAIVRSIFCVYDADEQAGGLALLEMAERVRIPLLKRCLIGRNQNEFWLDTTEGVEFLAYPDDTAPYYAGELITTWHLPPIQREVPEIW